MNRLASLLLLLLIAGVGCSSPLNPPTPPAITTLTFSWVGDGNPLVPICSTVMVDCKATIDVEDTTTGSITSLPVTQTNYTALDSSHIYQIRTSGYDKAGLALHSVWESVN